LEPGLSAVSNRLTVGRVTDRTGSAAPNVRLHHVPALDGLRGLAILLVLGVHTRELIPGGLLGVDLFFVLSGFLITSRLLAERARTGTISLREFYRRRALRLLPALILMLSVYLAATALLDTEGVRPGIVAAGFGISYVANLAQMGGLFEAEELRPLWSLAAEEQFYLLWPPILAIALALRASYRVLCVLLVGLALVSGCWRVALLASGASFERLWVGPDTHADPILLGCVAGVLYTSGALERVRFGDVALVVGASIVAMSAWFASETHVLLTFFAICSALVVLAAASRTSWWFTRVLELRPLRYLGKISYGLYLWHVPMLAAFGGTIGIPLALVVAGLSYRYVEQPFLRRKRLEPTQRRDQASPLPRPREAMA
jgi:peptidoglycan/LPS O-acetylase OafA/YrhL